MVAAAAGLTALAEQCRVSILMIAAAKTTSQLRFDLYINFFRKCTRVRFDLDKTQTQTLFNFREIDQDICTVETYLGEVLPDEVRRRMMALILIGLMIATSWELSLTALIGISIIRVIVGVKNYCIRRNRSRIQLTKSSLWLVTD